MLYVREETPANDMDGDTHKVADSVVCGQQRSLRVSHFLELEDCLIDFFKEPVRNDDEPALY
jgi:hypothetical protein